ncbi:hypothetical protein G6F40_014882 [Rhizopus arrhizus]|nr:hypothetical protein G6F32_014238 [Rhizopus arrhizus]KAG1083097.1 hypothetical protein G6F40_014882 [Rhizopus arrhizus]
MAWHRSRNPAVVRPSGARLAQSGHSSLGARLLIPNPGVPMKLYVPLLFVAALGGCTTARMTVTPDGRRGVSIDCSGSSSWSGCYEKAGQMCPGGYVVFSKDGDEGNAIAVGNRNGFTSTQMATRSMLVSCSH